jgi:hypothetical protein
MFNSLSWAWGPFVGANYALIGSENFILFGVVLFPICIAASWVTEKLGIGKAIHRSYQHYQEQQRIKEQRNQYLRRSYQEGYAAGRGWAEGMEDVREEQRERREYERSARKYPRNIEKFVYGNEGGPRDIEGFVFGEDSPRRRKKRRQFFEN